MTALICALTAAGAVVQILLWRSVLRDRREWRIRLEEIERRHTAALSASGAKFARQKMRIRYIRRLLEDMIERNGG